MIPASGFRLPAWPTRLAALLSLDGKAPSFELAAGRAQAPRPLQLRCPPPAASPQIEGSIPQNPPKSKVDLASPGNAFSFPSLRPLRPLSGPRPSSWSWWKPVSLPRLCRAANSSSSGASTPHPVGPLLRRSASPPNHRPLPRPIPPQPPLLRDDRQATSCQSPRAGPRPSPAAARHAEVSDPLNCAWHSRRPFGPFPLPRVAEPSFESAAENSDRRPTILTPGGDTPQLFLNLLDHVAHVAYRREGPSLQRPSSSHPRKKNSTSAPARAVTSQHLDGLPPPHTSVLQPLPFPRHN